jgi:hypothetical protein
MRFEDLSPEDQKLVNTDLGAFEKEAEARLTMCDEMYGVGFNKLATETADNLDAYYAKVAEAEATDESIQMDSESEKVAQELGSFIEKGYVDGLRKLGQERHGDEMAYLMPFLEEKVAAKGAKAFLHTLGKKFKRFGKDVGKKGKAFGKEVGKKSEKGVAAVKKYHSGAFGELKGGIKDVKKGKTSKGMKSVAKGGGKLVGPYAALAAGGGGAAYAAKKKD